ncbi:unnamed protein product [Caenorhabditis nigoni]
MKHTSISRVGEFPEVRWRPDGGTGCLRLRAFGGEVQSNANQTTDQCPSKEFKVPPNAFIRTTGLRPPTILMLCLHREITYFHSQRPRCPAFITFTACPRSVAIGDQRLGTNADPRTLPVRRTGSDKEAEKDNGKASYRKRRGILAKRKTI